MSIDNKSKLSGYFFSIENEGENRAYFENLINELYLIETLNDKIKWLTELFGKNYPLTATHQQVISDIYDLSRNKFSELINNNSKEIVMEETIC